MACLSFHGRVYGVGRGLSRTSPVRGLRTTRCNNPFWAEPVYTYQPAEKRHFPRLPTWITLGRLKRIRSW